MWQHGRVTCGRWNGSKVWTGWWRSNDVEAGGGLPKAVSSFPAPHLGISGLGGGGLRTCPEGDTWRGTAEKLPIPRTLTSGALVAQNTHPSLDLARRKINGWRGMQCSVQVWGRTRPILNDILWHGGSKTLVSAGFMVLLGCLRHRKGSDSPKRRIFHAFEGFLWFFAWFWDFHALEGVQRHSRGMWCVLRGFSGQRGIHAL